MNSLARAQANYDNELPTDDSQREAAIDTRTEQLKADYWQDLERLSDAFNDAALTIGWIQKGFATHPRAVTFLALLRDGSDDLKAMRMLREAMKDYISDKADDDAHEEFVREEVL